MDADTEVYEITISIFRGFSHPKEVRETREVIVSRTLTDHELELVLDHAEAKMEDFEANPDD